MNRRTLIDTLKAALAQAITERPQRRDFVNGELAWITYEREVMHQETNRQRAKRGRGPVSLADIRRVESTSEGHIDYVSKFAIGCAELVTK